METWPNKDKMDLQRVRPSLYKPDAEPELLSVLMTQNPKELDTLKQTQLLHEAIGGKKVAFWGLEYMFIHWCSQKRTEMPPTGDDYRNFAEDINLPLVELSNEAFPLWATIACAHSLIYDEAQRQNG